MIDASTFSTSYGALWNEITPTCELFVRQLNQSLLKRMFPPLPKSGTLNRTLIAEYAFSLFAERGVDWTKGTSRESDLLRAEARKQTNRRLQPLLSHGVRLDYDFDEVAGYEVREIVDRLSLFFLSDRETKVVLRPMFPGCGYIDASEGDVMSDEMIYEVKTADRLFRSSDVRQLITYAALNYVSKSFELSSIGLLNPRNGLYCVCEIDRVAYDISGRSPGELFSSVVEAITGGGTSR